MNAHAFWTVAPGVGEIRRETLPVAAPGACRITTLASGISRGTEALVFAGHVPPSQYEAMRAPLMGGAFPFPVKYGYSTVGLTEAGRRVFVLHPHQDVFLAPASMCIPVPDAVPTARAVLAWFGESRVIWGSDWPILTTDTIYPKWLSASEMLLKDLNELERDAVFGDNANLFYRLNL